MGFYILPLVKPLIFKRIGNINILYKLAAFLERWYGFRYERTAKLLAALFFVVLLFGLGCFNFWVFVGWEL